MALNLFDMHIKPTWIPVKSLFVLIIACSLIYTGMTYTEPSSCTTKSKYYNILSLQCSDCPQKTQQSALDINFCNCTTSYYPNWNTIGSGHVDSCLALTTAYNKNSQVLTVYDQAGTLSSQVVTCSGISYPKQEQFRCVSCGYDSNFTYSSALKACTCQNGYVRVGETCYLKKIAWNKVYTISDAFNYMAEDQVKVGCQQENLVKPCNMLLNLCAKAQYSSSNFYCSLLASIQSSNKSSLPTYKFSSSLTQSIGIYASSKLNVNTTIIKNHLRLFSVQYDIRGEVREIAPIPKQLFQCYVTDQDVVKFSSFGLKLNKYCAAKRTSKEQLFYDFYIQTSEGKYAQVPILFNGQYFKRLSPSSLSGSHKLTLQFVTQPPIRVPTLVISSSSSPSVTSTSRAQSVAITTTAAFIVFNVGLLVISILVMYRHVQYNPSNDSNDQFYLCKGFITILINLIYIWSYGLWIWLFGESLYIFVFYKFQQTIYLLLPQSATQWKQYYEPFLVPFYTMFSFTAFSLWNIIYSLSEVDYFMIDWERQKDTRKFQVGKQRKKASVWRKIHLVNQLFQLSIKRKINFYFVTLFSLLFLNGLEWINLGYEIPNVISLSSLPSNTSQQNVFLSYFIITFIFFIIGFLQLLIRNLFSTWFPLPAENFVDLCTMSNFSILIFNQYLHGYYIHGVHPLGQSQGSLQYIESTFQKQAKFTKAFNKGRGFRREDEDACQTFQAIFPYNIRRSYMMRYKAPLLQKFIPKNFQNQSYFNSTALPEDWDQSDYDQVQKISLSMLQNFKMYLESVKASLRNVQDRSWWMKLLSWPISQEIVVNLGSVPIFIKDKWNDFTNAFISGHEFLFFFNFINLVNFMFIFTKNIYFSSLIAIAMHQILFELPGKLLLKRNISKNTLIDEKFFN